MIATESNARQGPPKGKDGDHGQIGWRGRHLVSEPPSRPEVLQEKVAARIYCFGNDDTDIVDDLALNFNAVFILVISLRMTDQAASLNNLFKAIDVVTDIARIHCFRMSIATIMELAVVEITVGMRVHLDFRNSGWQEVSMLELESSFLLSLRQFAGDLITCIV